MCGANVPGSGVGGGQTYNPTTGQPDPVQFPYQGYYRTDPVTNKALPDEVARLTGGTTRLPDTGPAAVPIAGVGSPLAPVPDPRRAGAASGALNKTLLGA